MRCPDCRSIMIGGQCDECGLMTSDVEDACDYFDSLDAGHIPHLELEDDDWGDDDEGYVDTCDDLVAGGYYDDDPMDW